MAGKPLSVFVNIGARVGSSVGAATSAVERRFAQMGRRLRVAAAEASLAAKALDAGVNERRARLFEAGAMGYGLFEALRPAIEFEDRLVRIGNVAEETGPQLDAAGREVIRIGKRFGLGGRMALEGLNDFLAAGIQAEKGKTVLQTATGALEPTLMLAKTAGIDAAEAASTGVAAMQNMGVAVRDLGAAYDRMAKASKEGKFELGDMARYMPRLTSSAAKLGIKGVEGIGEISAALQVVMRGAADAEQAQNNLYNLYEKMFSGGTVKKFAKYGVNLTNVYAEAERSGRSYFDLVLDHVARLSKEGKDPFAFSGTFEDQQARSALQMLILHRQEYERIKDAVRNATGVLERDWARVSKTAKTNWDRFKASTEGLAISFGRTLLPALTATFDGISRLLNGFADFAEKHPAIAGALATLAVGAIGLKVALTAGAWAVGIFAANWLKLRAAMMTMGAGTLAGIAAGFARIRSAMIGAWLFAAVNGWGGIGKAMLGALNPIRLVQGAMIGLRAAVIGTGIGAILVGIALAGMWIANNWRGIGAFFTAFGKAFMKALGPVRPVLEPVIGLFKSAAGAVESFVGPISIERWTAWGTAAGNAVGGVVRRMIEFVQWVGKGVTKAREFFGLGPKAPPVQAKPLPGRARGGPVFGGRPYIVGEKGPELFVPSDAGRVVKASTTAAALASLAALPAAAQTATAPASHVNMGGVTIVIQAASDPAATAREVEAVLRRMAREQAGFYTD